MGTYKTKFIDIFSTSGNSVVQQNVEEGNGASSDVKSEPSPAVKEEPKDFDGDEVGDSQGQDDEFQA